MPLANTGGSGTQRGHWRESIFDTELMTGYGDQGNDPISRVTIAALQDLGYEVNYDSADNFNLDGFSSFSSETNQLISNINLTTLDITESSFPNFNGYRYINHKEESLNIIKTPTILGPKKDPIFSLML